MDSFRLCLVLAPLAAYLAFIGGLHLRSRPRILGGGQDLAALGFAVGGMLFVGPIELLVPQQAISRWGGMVWLLIAIMYALGILLAVLAGRPRLVIYNITASELRSMLAAVVQDLDPEVRWAGTTVCLPRVNIELHLEAGRWHTVALVATHDDQSLVGWRMLKKSLQSRLAAYTGAPNAWGAGLLLAAVALLAMLGWGCVQDPQALSQGFAELLKKQ